VIEEYANERHIMDGFVWHIVTENGETPYYPYAKRLEDLKLFVEECGHIIEEKLEDDKNNYGLAFYACGYNGKAQKEFISYWAERGVKVV